MKHKKYLREGTAGSERLLLGRAAFSPRGQLWLKEKQKCKNNTGETIHMAVCMNGPKFRFLAGLVSKKQDTGQAINAHWKVHLARLTLELSEEVVVPKISSKIF